MALTRPRLFPRFYHRMAVNRSLLFSYFHKRVDNNHASVERVLRSLDDKDYVGFLIMSLYKTEYNAMYFCVASNNKITKIK